MRAGRFSLVLALVGALLTGCGELPGTASGGKTTEASYLPNTNPENVLRNLEETYARKDISGYQALFDTSFVFRPKHSDPTDPSAVLTYEDDQLTTKKMFDQVEKLSLALSFDGSGPCRLPAFPAVDGYQQIVVDSVTIDVAVQISVVDSLLTIHMAEPRTTVFVFKPNESTDPVTWRIVYQDDRYSP